MGVVRKTKYLEEVLHVFHQSSDALSASMLLDCLATEINKSTVYRLLEKLEDDGVIHSFSTTDQIRFYALCKGCSGGRCMIFDCAAVVEDPDREIMKPTPWQKGSNDARRALFFFRSNQG